MLSADDASKLTVPLAIYISQDEPVDEVSLVLTSPAVTNLSQYTKIVDILGKKSFAAQCDSKNYDYMYVQHQLTYRRDNDVCSGSTGGLQHAVT